MDALYKLQYIHLQYFNIKATIKASRFITIHTCGKTWDSNEIYSSLNGRHAVFECSSSIYLCTLLWYPAWPWLDRNAPFWATLEVKEGRKEKLYCKRKLRFKAAASATTTAPSSRSKSGHQEGTLNDFFCVRHPAWEGEEGCSTWAKSERGLEKSTSCSEH